MGTQAAGPLVLGVDSSTQSTKALVVDAATGAVVARGQAPHTVTGGADGTGKESDPEGWWRALGAALEQCGHWVRQVAAVSVAGQQHGLVALDAAGSPVRPALLWNDVRSAPHSVRLIEELGGAGAWARRTGSVPGPAFTAAKWAWLRAHEPDAARATAAVRLPHDYLTERLTGQAVTDRGDVSGTGWWASGTESYDAEVLRHLALPPEALPRVARPGEVVGTVRPGDLPLPSGALVAGGTGDNMAAALGLGLRPGRPVLSLGTSGTVYAVATRRPADPTGTVAGFADARGGWLPLACTLNCTLAVDRIAALLSRDREAVEPVRTEVVLPFLDGERTPNLPHASGLVHGLRHDTTPGRLLQAAYDGAVFALLRALESVLAVDAPGGRPPADGPDDPDEPEELDEPQGAGHAAQGIGTGTASASDADVPRNAAGDVPVGAVYGVPEGRDVPGSAAAAQEAAAPEPLLLIGGGARGRAWRETVRRLSGRPVVVPEARELVALGAAAQAAGLLLGEDPAAVARRWDTARGPSYEPVARDTAAWERLAATLSAGAALLR
ncbi:xylulokinase [Streptomyces sp. NPDC003077]|uniref:xylulokinase n=1 Tax=Streptomyces sp. NPDC003077 TaxID=3154443 RepID=UPI0033BEFA07